MLRHGELRRIRPMTSVADIQESLRAIADTRRETSVVGSRSLAASPAPGGAVYREIESRSWEMGSGPPGDIRTRTHVAALRRAAGKLIDEGTTFTSGLS